MVTELGGSTIWSSDLKNSLPFYRDIVGLPVAIETDGFVVFGPQGQPALALGTHSEVRGNASDPYRHIVGFISTDVKADHERMKAADVDFIEEPNLQPGGGLWLATFKDPEGNICQLLQFIER
jgi:predicted enzyme related to lactoylglutathione lyase